MMQFMQDIERGQRQPRPIDVEGLARDLRCTVEGEVRFDAGSRALYATDASNYRQVPIGVVIPTHAQDVIDTMTMCRRYGAPVVPRGAATSLSGQTCNVAVVLDFSKYMNRILELDPDAKRARVQPGVVLDDLRKAAEEYHLTFPPDPSTHRWCTLGGMIGNNSCGVHSVMGGKTEENVEELDVLTYDGVRLRVGRTTDEELQRRIEADGRSGDIYRRLKTLRDEYEPLLRRRYPDIPRRVSGFNLLQLLPEQGFHVARALVARRSEGENNVVRRQVNRRVNRTSHDNFRSLGACPSNASLRGKGDAGRCEAAGSKKPEAYSLEYVEGFFRAENDADACRSFSTVERHYSDSLLGCEPLTGIFAPAAPDGKPSGTPGERRTGLTPMDAFGKGL